MSTKLINTPASVTVTNTATTLIDWLDIRDWSSFILTINNTGAKDLYDVLIDSSTDGGVTITTGAVDIAIPDVPAHYAGSWPVTLTANYIRVRAYTASGETTTASASLFAVESSGYLCTLSDIKTRLAITDTSHDAQLESIRSSVSSIFDAHCKRTLLAPAADVTEYYTQASRFIQLNRWPVISITSIRIALDWDFINADALTANTDYRLMQQGKNGHLMHLYNNWYGDKYPDCVEVIYKGGYCAAAVIPATGQFALPADIREAAIMQSSFIFQKRDSIAVKSTSFNGGSMDTFSPMELLPMVKEILSHYMRPQL